MNAQLKTLLTRYVDAGVIPGAVALIGAADREPDVLTVGSAAVGGPAIRPDAIMRIQSMTKALTAAAALRLVEAGRLGLDDGLEPWLPELSNLRVLTSPAAELSETVPVVRPITLRHLLTNTSGYGMAWVPSPLQQAMVENKTEASAAPVSLGADEWLARLTELPLAFQPGEGWRYHHSFAILGILISRITGRSTNDHLRDDLLDPLGMTDTSFWVPAEKTARLPPAYRLADTGLIETEPAGGGFYSGPPPFDVSHAEVVSTAHDYYRFLRMLADGGTVEGRRLLSADHVRAMTTDQVPEEFKTRDSFLPGFWDRMGWGFGVCVQLGGPHAGRYGWSGGQGTDFLVDPDGRIGILLTQVELCDPIWGLFLEFQEIS